VYTFSEIIAGVDEAGRGPLAGPVVAAAVILEQPILGLNDSKKLTRLKRAQLFSVITKESRAWSFAVGSVAEIDRVNILQATKLAMARAVNQLLIVPDKVLVDGRDTIDIPMPCQAIVKGDQKELAIMAASIVAKHIRDHIMDAMSQRYPGYGFHTHAGYGTVKHRAAIGALGVLPHHRKSFCKVPEN